MNMTEQVKVGVSDGVMEITWNRPEKKNAITNAMYKAVGEAFERASGDKSIRVALFTSEGDSFTAGNDLSVFAAANSGAPAEPPQGHRLIHSLAKFEKPLVAGVRGVAVGVGTTMLLHCDLVYVAKDAKLTTPFVNLALVPEAASSILLPARVGHARAFAMFALGEALTGEQAAQIGIANVAVPADQVIATARDAARKLAQRPLGALMATKKLMRDGEVLLQQMHREGAVFAERLKSAEAAEAFAAFAQKRAPDFSKVTA
jgi:enoyl-CoA hydratase/carnithine racemase